MNALSLRALGVPGRLDALDLDLTAGRVHLVVGPNGAGKTTLLRAIAGLISDATGQVLHGARVLAPGAHHRADVVGWLPQSAPVEAGLTALEVVATARFRFHAPQAVAARAAVDALTAVGLADRASVRVDRLSGGERQRVRLAALVAQQTPWWLLDEPSNHLDPRVQLEVLDHIEDQAERGGVVVVTHDLLPLARWPNARVLGFASGRLQLDLQADDPELPSALTTLFGVGVSRLQGGAWTVDARPR